MADWWVKMGYKPCPKCGAEADLEHHYRNIYTGTPEMEIFCKKCKWYFLSVAAGDHSFDRDAQKYYWNVYGDKIRDGKIKLKDWPRIRATIFDESLHMARL